MIPALWTALATTALALTLVPSSLMLEASALTPHALAKQEAYPNFYTDETATPNVYLVSYVDGLGDGVREPEDDTQYEPAGAVSMNSPPVPQDPWEICNDYGAQLEEVCEGLGIFIATMSEDAARAMSNDPRVEFVEGDREGEGHTVQNLPGDFGFWGLDTIDQRTSTRNFTFSYSSTGTNVHLYVLDSGITTAHVEFGGRATNDAHFAGSTPYDNHGHGTAVASVASGAMVGVAKNARIHSVRMLGNTNRTRNWQIAKAIRWVKVNHQLPAVVNMSFGGRAVPYIPFFQMGTPPIEKATKRLIRLGLVVVVSAGNDTALASKYVPAKVIEAITVGATDYTWTRRSTTNYGSRIDLFGPGEDVIGAFFDSTALYGDYSGTSLAAPFVAGVACQYLSVNPSASPAEVDAWLKANATDNVVSGSFPKPTTRRFLFTNW